MAGNQCAVLSVLGTQVRTEIWRSGYKTSLTWGGAYVPGGFFVT